MVNTNCHQGWYLTQDIKFNNNDIVEKNYCPEKTNCQFITRSSISKIHTVVMIGILQFWFVRTKPLLIKPPES
jgi:hypothetical protein